MNKPRIEEQIIEKKKDLLLPASILMAALIIAFAWVYVSGLKAIQSQRSAISASDTGEQSEENTAQAIEKQNQKRSECGI